MRRLAVLLLAMMTALMAQSGVPASGVAGTTVPLANFSADGRQQTRFDTAGNAIDAHDGQIAQFGNSYYLYGTSYDCGYQWTFNTTFCGFKVYSSPDLTHWTDRGFVVPARSCQYCFRPHVVFNEHTRKYVMWVNDQDALDNFRVYTSDRPDSGFTEQQVPDLPAGTSCSADLGLFVDDDGTAYLTCSRANWHIAVIQLTSDYLGASGKYTVTGVTKVEAPALFKRGGTYYLTMSDPNCGYCTATGTSYLTAPSPLGPWRGRDAWTVTDGVLNVHGGLYGLSRDGENWTDYTFSFDTAPLLNATRTLTQAGWAVHMQSDDYGYLFLLNGSGDNPGHLQVLRRAGATAASHQITLGYPIRPGEWHHVSVQVSGDTMTTSIDGAVVDTYTDSTYRAGNVGFREWNGAGLESALFDNATVTSPSGEVLLSDDFSSPELTQWIAPTSGVKISTTSCGGQPAHVATLQGADGQPVYLYFSDLWDFHTNEGLANYYWEPLRFDPTGAIQPLQCDNSGVDLRDVQPGHQDAVAALDQSSGIDGYSPACAVSVGQQIAQTFTAGRNGQLSTVAVTAYQDGTETGRVLRHPPTAPLDARLIDYADGPGATLWSGSIAPAQIGWSARNLVFSPNITVERGHEYALILSTTSPQGCYGVEVNYEDPYAAGTILQSTDNATTLSEQSHADLKFFTTVSDPAGTS